MCACVRACVFCVCVCVTHVCVCVLMSEWVRKTKVPVNSESRRGRCSTHVYFCLDLLASARHQCWIATGMHADSGNSSRPLALHRAVSFLQWNRLALHPGTQSGLHLTQELGRMHSCCNSAPVPGNFDKSRQKCMHVKQNKKTNINKLNPVEAVSCTLSTRSDLYQFQL